MTVTCWNDDYLGLMPLPYFCFTFFHALSFLIGLNELLCCHVSAMMFYLCNTLSVKMIKQAEVVGNRYDKFKLYSGWNYRRWNFQDLNAIIQFRICLFISSVEPERLLSLLQKNGEWVELRRVCWAECLVLSGRRKSSAHFISYTAFLTLE